LQEAADRHRRRRHHVERLPRGRVTVLDRELERLRHVVGVDVVQELGAKARNNDLLAGRAARSGLLLAMAITS
jgi:hypothetical protein